MTENMFLFPPPNLFISVRDLRILFFPLTNVSELSHLASTALHFIEYVSATLQTTLFIDAVSSFHCNGGTTGNHDYVIALFNSEHLYDSG